MQKRFLIGVDLRWNTKGSFVGRTLLNVNPAPTEGEDDRVLLYNDFLVSPLLPTGPGYIEQKFSGSDDFEANTDTLGRVMDAYAHHVIADSGGTLMLTDLQGMINAGFLTMIC